MNQDRLEDKPMDLNPDSPHSPDRTREAGRLLSETARLLAYCTRADSGGVRYPAHAYSLIADFYLMAGSVSQSCSQIGVFLTGMPDGNLTDDDDRDPRMVTGMAKVHLNSAADAARELVWFLQQAQNTIAGLAWTGPVDDD